MKKTLINVTTHLQLCFAKLTGCYVVILADSNLTGKFVTPITKLLTLFLSVKYRQLSIAYLL